MDERIAVLVLCLAVALCLATVSVAIRKVRTATLSLPPGALWREQQADPLAPYVTPVLPEPVITEDDTIRALSNRLAAIEGTMPNLRQQIDTFQSLTGRVSALETEIPGLADAWERFSDAMGKKEKRDLERDRRGKKREVQSAGDAAQEFLGPLGSGTGVPAVTPAGAPPLNGPSRSIVGRGRARGAK